MAAVRRPARKPPSPQGGDERLLVEAAQSDLSKFDALYELHFERIYFFVIGRVRDRAIAEDLTSEVFHKALANLSSFEWRGTPFVAWLFRIASNAIADQHKRAGHEQPADEETIEQQSAKTITSREFERVERQTNLLRLVEKLPTLQKRVVRERFLEERSIKEIAERLKKTEGAIKQLQFRALQSLREQAGGRHA